MKQKLLVLAIFVSVLYGSSYDQFRFFDKNKPRGLTDTKSYLEMSNGNYNVNAVHKYRFITPLAVYSIKRMLNIGNDFNVQIFYVINFSITIVSSFLLYQFLLCNGATIAASVLCGIFFLTSRVIVNAQVPLVDSVYFFGIITIVYLISLHRYHAIYFILPILVVMKENILPIALLVFLRKDFLKRNEIVLFSISLLISLLFAYCIRMYIDIYSTQGVSKFNIIDIVFKHISLVKYNVYDAISLKGANDILSAFGLLYVLLFHSLYVSTKKIIEIDMYIWGLLPISIVYSLLSGNIGRMLFTSYPLVLLIIAKYLDHTVLKCKYE